MLDTQSSYFLQEAIFEKEKYLLDLGGILTGLSFDSKYTRVFLIIGLFGFLLIAKPYRKLLFSRWFLFIPDLFCHYHPSCCYLEHAEMDLLHLNFSLKAV